jgi:capsular polysaccharide export protein
MKNIKKLHRLLVGFKGTEMIVIYVDNFDRATFFYRLAKGMNEKKFLFYTTKYSVYCFLKKDFEVTLFNENDNHVNNCNDMPSETDFLNLTYVYRGSQSVAHAKKVYMMIRDELALSQLNYQEIEVAIVFNGNSASQKAFIDHFSNKDVKTLFCEISNLPGKVIFDPLGVNAKSSLFLEAQRLDKLESIDIEEHQRWVEVYENYKNNPIPQGKLEPKFIKAYLLDYFSSLLGQGTREEDKVSLIKKITSVLKLFKSKSSSNLIFDSADLSCDYIFFPTQVRYDSQLILNSDIDNQQAIEQAAVLASERNCKLYVKIHPAETDPNILKDYISLKNKYNFSIVNSNTTELIKNAKVVVTINSTVGLEALIYNKELKVYGRAIYSDFDFSRVLSYIHNYLVDFDYFSDELINKKEFNKLLTLASK